MVRHPLFEGTLALRRERGEDRPALRALYASTRQEELAAVPWPEATKAAFLDQQFALQHHHYVTHFPAADFLVVVSSGALVGRIYRDGVAPEATGEACDTVIDVSLLPGWRGRGLGTALLRAVMEDAARRGRGVALSVFVPNERARRLYERLGFTAVAMNGPYLAMRWRTSPG